MEPSKSGHPGRAGSPSPCGRRLFVAILGPGALVCGLLGLSVLPGVLSGPPDPKAASADQSFPQDPGRSTWSLALSPDGHWLASARMDGVVQVDDLTAGTRETVEGLESGLTRTLTFTPDSRTLILGNEGLAVDIETARSCRGPFGLGLAVIPGKAMTFSPDGTLFAVYLAAEGRIIVRHWATRHIVVEFPCGSVATRGLAFSPDGKELAAGLNSGEVVVWNLVAGSQRLRFRAADRLISGLAYPDGESLVTACTNSSELRFWGCADGCPLGALACGGLGVRALELAPDRRFAALACTDGNGRLVNLHRREVADVFSGPGGPFRALAFSPDGRQLTDGRPGHWIRLEGFRESGASRGEEPGRPPHRPGADRSR